MIAVLAEAALDAPCPRVGLTITGLGIGESVATVWRSADGARSPVSGARRTLLNDATFITDYWAPVGRPVVYEIEVITGPDGASRTASNTVTLDTGGEGYLMDPLVPQTCVPVVGAPDSSEDLYLRDDALRSLEYNADVSKYKIMGSDKPLALFGQRMAEENLDTSLSARSVEQNARLKRLLKSTGQLLFRPSPEWGDLDLPGVMHLGNARAARLPVNVLIGGDVTWWDLKSDVVGAPTVRILTAAYTYGDVSLLFSTYEQKEDTVIASAAVAGEDPTYLFDMKHPIG